MHRTNYPVSIAFMLVYEFCERFSFYSIRAVLTLYFIQYLYWDNNLSAAVYHAFSSFCYFTPLLGAIIADSWLGKFRTIIYLYVVYVFGHVMNSVAAIPNVGSHVIHIVLCMTGLILIGVGAGGIRPCATAFEGDQFKEEHVKERRTYISIVYMSISVANVGSAVTAPILRGNVRCFGGDCFALVFGVSAGMMLTALVVFVCGSGLYIKRPPEGNVLLNVCKCIGFAIKNRWKSSKHEPNRDHWLDWAEEKYSKRLICETKMVLRVLVLYIPLPMFWALYEQKGSRWTQQAARMDVDFGVFTIKPEQMQMLNSFLVLVFVPTFDMALYPLIGLCKINFTPLKKMATGMTFAVLAFVSAMMVEINVSKSVLAAPLPRESLLQVLNLADGNVSVSIPQGVLFDSIISYENPKSYQSLHLNGVNQSFKTLVTFGDQSVECLLTFHEKKAYSLILYSEASTIQCKLVENYIGRSENGDAYLRFINTMPESVNITVDGKDFWTPGSYGISHTKSVKRGQYNDVKCKLGQQQYLIDLGLLDFGASYTLILNMGPEGIVTSKMEDVHTNSVHIAWQIPQYVLMTAGDVMLSITGMEFSYSQAPASMKSVLQAGWLLTVGFGNMLVLIIVKVAQLEQWIEFLLFAGLLLAVCVIFSTMAHFYTYVSPVQMETMFQGSDTKGDHDKGEDVMKMNQFGTLNMVIRSTKM